jgi:CHAT domain-containing protein/tetratricopeptide (TPR) repeat protein
LEYYDKAIELHTKAGYNLGIGKGYQGISTVALNTGDNKKAEEAAKKSIEYFELAGFKSGIGNIYELLASMNMNAGNLDKAEELLGKALQYYRDADFIIGMGNAHYTLGQIAVNRGNYTKAIVENQKAILYYEKSGYLLGLGNVNYILGQIALITEDNFDGVISYSEKAKKFYTDAKYTLGLGKVAFSKGTIYFIQERYNEAIEEIKTALKYFSASDYGFFEILGHFTLADIYIQQSGKKEEALENLRQAIEYLEKFRSNLVRQEDRTSFYEKFSAYLQFSVVSAISLEEPKLAFRYLENIKSRTLNELLTERSVNLSSKIEPELLLERNRLEKLITSLKTGMNTNSVDEMESNKQQLKQYEEQLDKLIFEIRTINPAFAAVEYPKSMDIKEIRDLLDKDEVVLQFFLSNNNSWLFLTSKDNFEIIPLGATEDSIAQFGSIFLDGLRRNKFGKDIPAADMDIEEEISLDASKKLYNLLIKPAEKKFAKDVRLTIIPDGILNLIPFEVLVDDSLYLIEKHSINYFQSATLMGLMRTDLKKEHKSRGFAGFGDPVYDLENFNKGADERGVKIAQRGDGKYEDAVEDEFSRAGLTLFRLRGTGEEINGIADVFRSMGEPVNIKLRKDANEGNAKLEELKNYRYIVFACHGIINPGFQSLALAVEDSLTRTEDGYLTFEEMLNLDWDAELVVLSACQTGTGELKRTEGIVGLTRAVMYAGADAVTVSLWNVSDKGTKELMIGFFESLINKNLSKTEALRQSKLSFIQKGTRPYYWSPFVIYGE